MNAWLGQFATGGGGVSLIAFACMFGAAVLTVIAHPHLPERSRNSATHEVVKLATSMIVVMTSVVLGLLASAMSSGFSAVDQDVRKLATGLILTDRALREYGPDAGPARAVLARYTRQALVGTWPPDGGAGVVEDRSAGALLDDTELAILALQPADPEQRALAVNAEARLRGVLDQRWTLIAELQGTVSIPLMAVVIAWLTLVFASLGYNAPRNRVVLATLLLSAASMAAAIFLIVELAGPFDGLLKVSGAPMQRALETLQR